MTIARAHEIIRFFVNKEIAGYTPPERIDIALDTAQRTEISRLYGRPEQYQVGRAIPPIAYGQSHRISDDLARFREDIQFNSNIYNQGTNPYGTGTDGILRLPADYMYLLAVWSEAFQNQTQTNRTRPVKILNEDQLADRIDSFILAPSEVHPVGIMAGKPDGIRRIQFYPISGKTGTVIYLREPAVPKFAYNMVGRVVTQDIGTSVDLEWDGVAANRVIFQALSYLGIHLRSVEDIQVAEGKLNTGA